VLIMDAVLETYQATDVVLWPVAAPPADHLLALSGRMAPAEVGTAIAVLTSSNDGDHEDRGRSEDGAADRVGHLMTAERVIAPGGLRLRDTVTGVTVSPSCCSGLEDWRDWLGLVNGEEPWLGHDPTPHIEHLRASVRLWPDEDLRRESSIDLPRAQLPELLGSVRDQLVGFLAAAEEWTAQHTPALAARLVAKLDEDLAISASLPQDQR
jgi:hypothetical protein